MNIEYYNIFRHISDNMSNYWINWPIKQNITWKSYNKIFTATFTNTSWIHIALSKYNVEWHIELGNVVTGTALAPISCLRPEVVHGSWLWAGPVPAHILHLSEPCEKWLCAVYLYTTPWKDVVTIRGESTIQLEANRRGEKGPSLLATNIQGSVR